MQNGHNFRILYPDHQNFDGVESLSSSFLNDAFSFFTGIETHSWVIRVFENSSCFNSTVLVVYKLNFH